MAAYVCRQIAPGVQGQLFFMEDSAAREASKGRFAHLFYTVGADGKPAAKAFQTLSGNYQYDNSSKKGVVALTYRRATAPGNPDLESKLHALYLRGGADCELRIANKSLFFENPLRFFSFEEGTSLFSR